MRTLTITPLLILALVLGMIATPELTASTKIQGFLSVKGTSIVDSYGHVVVLRGVNYPGYEYARTDPRPHSKSAYQTFARMGFNVVRLPISWANLEPFPGAFYSSYLSNYVDRDVGWTKENGLYIILDMHQFNWAERFGGVGVPDWAVGSYPATELGKRQAISDFWNSTALQDHFIAIWSKIAQRYAKENAVGGYDVMNEPWIYNSVNSNLTASHVAEFYANVIRSIRAYDPNHIIFLEPANMQDFTFPVKDNIVWSPHFYPLSFGRQYSQDNITFLEADFAAKYKKFVLEMGTPIWIGEFGAFMRDTSSNQKWLHDAVTVFDKYHVGWAWWAYYGGADSSTLIFLHNAAQ